MQFSHQHISPKKVQTNLNPPIFGKNVFGKTLFYQSWGKLIREKPLSVD